MRLTEAATYLKNHQFIVFKAHGHSMHPRIKNGETVSVLRVDDPNEICQGDVVLVKVRGRWWLHKVARTSGPEMLEISNNRGHSNGWTSRSKVVGKVVPWEEVQRRVWGIGRDQS